MFASYRKDEFLFKDLVKKNRVLYRNRSQFKELISPAECGLYV